jgi:hypothetical protein
VELTDARRTSVEEAEAEAEAKAEKRGKRSKYRAWKGWKQK